MTRDFLFATWDGGGNLPPVLTLARRLIARGHTVRIVSDDCARTDIEAAGAEFAGWKAAPNRPDRHRDSDPMQDWTVDGAEMLRRIVDRLMCGTAALYARDLLDEHERRPADAIVTSEMLLGSMIAGEAAGIPVAALGCNIPIVPLPGMPPFGPGFHPARNEAQRALHAEVQAGLDALLAEGLAPLNAARVALGLAPLANVWDQFARLDAYLVATARAFDFPAEALPLNLHYVGPLLDEPAWAEGAEAALPPGDAPLVPVALSTTYQAQEEAMRRVAAAIGMLGARGVVTTGPAVDPASIAAPPGVAIVSAAPHGLLMRDAAAVVTHCGHGTVMRALSAGLPLLCIPMGRDQNDNAARVEAGGAGIRLAADAGVEEIGDALSRLLAEPAYRAAAERLGAAIRAETDPERAADLVEGLAARAAREPRCAA